MTSRFLCSPTSSSGIRTDDPIQAPLDLMLPELDLTCFLLILNSSQCSGVLEPEIHSNFKDHHKPTSLPVARDPAAARDPVRSGPPAVGRLTVSTSFSWTASECAQSPASRRNPALRERHQFVPFVTRFFTFILRCSSSCFFLKIKLLISGVEVLPLLCSEISFTSTCCFMSKVKCD